MLRVEQHGVSVEQALVHLLGLRVDSSFYGLGSTMMGCVGVAPVSCAQEKGGDSVWPFKECTSHGAMDGDKSLLASLRIKGDSAPF